jgi:galactan 5-O-arabinofuranosyltransferase
VVLRLERPRTEDADLRRAGRAWAVVASIGILCALGALFVLRASPFPPGGLGGDQGFRAAAVAHDAVHLLPGDFAYRALPGYYPPLYFVALGRIVAITGIPAYEALKWGGIAIAGIVPLLGFALWRRCTGDVAVALAMVVAGLALHEWYEPYSWIATVAFVPWWCTYVVRPDGLPDRSTRTDCLLGSLVGAAILVTYTYPFPVAAVQLVAVLVLGWVCPRRVHLSVTASSAKVLAGTAFLSAPYWVPLVVRELTNGGFTPLQNRYFEQWMIAVPLPFLEPTIEGLVMLMGLVALIALVTKGDALALALLSLVGAAYAWFVLGYVAVLADSPLLAYRSITLVQVALAAGAGLGAVRGLRALRDRDVQLSRTVLLAASACAALLLVVTAVDAIPYVSEQQAARPPTDVTRLYDKALAGRRLDGVVFTSVPALLAARPVEVFNVWNAHYANPFADFTGRSRFLGRLANERDPAVIAAALRHNRYDRVGVLVLDRVDGHLRYTDYQDAFPRGTRARTLTFETAQFAAPWFHRLAGREQVVFVTTRRDPAASLDPAQRAELLRQFPGDLARS